VVPLERHGLGVRAFFIVRVSLLQRKYFGVRADLSAMQSYLRGCAKEHHYIVRGDSSAWPMPIIDRGGD
jgi:hypothetical protein